MRAPLWVGLVGASACFDRGFIIDDIGFFDTAGDRAETPCGETMRFLWPAPGAPDLDPLTAPELFLEAGLREVEVRLVSMNTGLPTAAHVVARPADGGRTLQIVPDAPLPWGEVWRAEAQTQATDDTDGACFGSVETRFITRAEPAPTGSGDGAWWLGGGDRANASASVLQRLLPRQDAAGGGYGVALALATSGDTITLRTISRTADLPSYPCDAPDVGVITRQGAGAFASLAPFTLDDPQRPLSLRGLDGGAVTIEGYYDPSTDRWFGLHLTARIDLRAWSDADRAEACSIAAGRGLRCVECEDGTADACLDIDARGMSADRLDHGLDEPFDVCTR